MVLTRQLQPRLSQHCYRLADRDGVKAALRAVRLHLPCHRFVFRTDVRGYYASIGHDRLYERLERLISEKPVLRLIWGYLHRTLRDRGFYREMTRGISLGCPLSPLMGALYLQPLDEHIRGYTRCCKTHDQ